MPGDSKKKQFSKTRKKVKKKSSQRVSSKDVIKAYTDFIFNAEKNGYNDVEDEISEARFKKLCLNSDTNECDFKSIQEAKGALLLELSGDFTNVRRPSACKLDFTAEDKNRVTVFINHKQMIDLNKLQATGINIFNFPNHKKIAYNMGKFSVGQKDRHLNLEPGFPKSRSDVIHVFNFVDILDNSEKSKLVASLLQGAKDAGYDQNMIFINHEN